MLFFNIFSSIPIRNIGVPLGKAQGNGGEKGFYIRGPRGSRPNTKCIKKGEKNNPVVSVEECEHKANHDHNYYREQGGVNNEGALCTRKCLGTAGTLSGFEYC